MNVPLKKDDMPPRPTAPFCQRARLHNKQVRANQTATEKKNSDMHSCRTHHIQKTEEKRTYHSPFVRITVQAHCGADTYELSANSPYLLGIVLRQREIMRANKEKLDELKGQRAGLGAIAAKGVPCNVIVSAT